MALQHITESISNERITDLICGLVSIPSVTSQERAIGDMTAGKPIPGPLLYTMTVSTAWAPMT